MRRSTAAYCACTAASVPVTVLSNTGVASIARTPADAQMIQTHAHHDRDAKKKKLGRSTRGFPPRRGEPQELHGKIQQGCAAKKEHFRTGPFAPDVSYTEQQPEPNQALRDDPERPL